MSRCVRWAGVLALWGVAVPTGAAAEEEKAIYSLVDGRPTREKILKFLEGGVEWGGEYAQGYWLTSNGLADEREHSDGATYTYCRCEQRARYEVLSDRIQFSCRHHCWSAHSKNWDADDLPVDMGASLKKMVLRVLFVSPDAMLVQDAAGERWFVSECSNERKREDSADESDIARGCKPIQLPARKVIGRPHRFLVNVIPGASDEALFEAVKMNLKKADGEDLRRAILFEGEPARVRRLKTEVFYAIGDDDAAASIARKVAEALKSLVGEIEPKIWPGRWPFDVTVVVGTPQEHVQSVPADGGP